MKPFLLLLSITLLQIAAPRRADAQQIVIVVQTANSISTLSKDQVSDLFLKRVMKWDNGEPVVPIDQDRSAKVRETFSRIVHRRSVAAIMAWWQTQIFSGNNVPPAMKATDADVLAFVRTHPNAIGYIGADTPLGANIKVVAISGL